MPSHLENSSTLVIAKNKKNGRKAVLLFSKRTGYKDVWFNGVHYYYNAEAHSRNGDTDISLQKMIEEKRNKKSGSSSKIAVRGAKFVAKRGY